jgi:hypothetical protein
MVMSKRGLVLGLLGLSGLCPGMLVAQGVTIDHKGVGCIVAEQFPKMNACFSPAGSVARARVYFRAAGGPYWYFVEGKAPVFQTAQTGAGAQPCMDFVLPKPKKTITKMDYYVEAVDKAFAESRSSEYNPDVVKDAGACRKDAPAAPIASNATVTVGAAAGAPIVPAGFAGVAGAAGLSTTAVVAGVAGAGAATAGVVAISNGSSKTTTTPSSTPPTAGPTPPPPAPTPSTGPPPTPPPAPQSNQPPAAVFAVTPDPPIGTAPFAVKFSMCGTTDPDGDPLTYNFSFGDGQTAQGGCSTQHVYTFAPLKAQSLSTFNASISVSDDHGHEAGRGYTVNLDCPVPVARVTNPPAGSTVDSCATSTVSATATDPIGVSFVTFFADCYSSRTTIGTATAPPYSASWSPGRTGCFFGPATVIAQAHNSCGGVGSGSVNVDVQCQSGKTPAGSARVSVTSQLAVPGARGQVFLNGAIVSAPAEGRSMALGDARRGENRVEAQLVASGGRPGTWRFELGANQLFQPGSLRALSGDVAEATSEAIVFRLSGKTGERLAFTFRVKE